MSQTSPSPADQTDHNSRVINNSKINSLFSSDSGDVRSTINNDDLQPDSIFPPQQEQDQRLPRQWWRVLSFKTQAFALAIACLTLPVIAVGATVYYFANRSITEQSTPANQAGKMEPAEIASVPRTTRLPLTLLVETVVAGLLLMGLLAVYLANRAMRPVLIADATAEELDEEKLESADIALARLATLQNQPKLLPEGQEAETERKQSLQEITLRIRESVFLENVLKTTVKEVRRALKADRVFFYRFNSDWSGHVVAESVAHGWPSCLKIKVTDTYFSESTDGVEKYKNGRICVVDNIHDSGLSDCHIRLLEQFAIKSNLIAPILQNDHLFGLMIANQCSEPRVWEKHDVDLFVQLASQVGLALDQISFVEKQEAEVEQAQLLTEITLRIRQSLYLEDILKTTVKEVRRALNTDRVLIYGLDPTSWDGIVIAESVASAWPQTLRVRINDPCLREGRIEMFKNGHVRAINDIYQEPGLADCYIKTLEQFAIKATLVAPILRNSQLLGLMIANQCSAPRIWEKQNIDLFLQLAIQVGLAVDQASLLEQIDQGHSQ